MSHRTHFRTALALSLLTAAGCASSTQNTPRNELPTAAPTATAAAPAALPTPQAPQGLIVQVHAASLGPIAERIGGMVGLTQQVNAGLDELLADAVGHDPALAAVVDRSGPVHIAVAARGQEDVDFAFSLAVPHATDVEQRLGQSHRVGDRTPDGLHIISQTSNEARARRGSVCAIVETGSDSSSRLVCSRNREGLDRLGAWLGRGVTTQVPPFTVRAELAVEALRGQYGEIATLVLTQLATGGVDSLMRVVPESARTPPVREAMGRVLDLATETARSIVSDLATGSLTVTFEPERVVVGGESSIRNSQATLVRALTGATQGNTLPTELTAGLPAGGFAYTAATVDAEPLRPVLMRFADLGVAVVRGDGRTALRAPDADALHTALEHFVNALGRTQVAGASGADNNGAPWAVSTARFANAQGPTASIATTREVITALRRPAVVRNVNALFAAAMSSTPRGTPQTPPPDMRQLREVPVRGLPAGSLAYQMPNLRFSPERRTEANPPARGRAPARPLTTVVALVPSGNDLRILSGPDAAAVAALAASPTPAPAGPEAHPAPDAAAWAAAGGWVSALFIPAGFPNFMRRTGAEEASNLERAMATLPHRGRDPLSISSGLSVQGDTTSVTGTFVVTRDTLGLWVAAMARRSTAPAPPPQP